MENLEELNKLLFRADFYIGWIVVVSLIYLLIAICKKGKDLFVFINYLAFIISTISIVGAMSVLCHNFLCAYSQNANYDLNYMFNCLGDIAVLCISFKTMCDKLGYPDIFKKKAK